MSKNTEITVTSAQYASAAKAVTAAAMGESKIARDYDTLLTALGLSVECDADAFTAASRKVVLDAWKGIKGKAHVTVETFVTTPTEETTEAERDIYNAPRAVRAGLMRAAKRAAAAAEAEAEEAEETEDSTPDYLALAIQAASTAVTKGDLSPESILKALAKALSSDEATFKVKAK